MRRNVPPEEDTTGVHYHPLDTQLQQFRLLTLLRGSGDEPIRCRINVHPLENCPLFAALSYHWGDPTPVFPAEIGEMGSKVSHNLGVALQHLRRPESDRVL